MSGTSGTLQYGATGEVDYTDISRSRDSLVSSRAGSHANLANQRSDSTPFLYKPT